MSSDVVLTAALRNNLLSLQNTQSLIDRTQLRLATGRKVNSALDNAQSFFAAQSLNNRASDLSRLLDGLGQSIQTIKAADDGITALTQLVEQADSLATQALEATSSAGEGATIVGNIDVTDYENDGGDTATITFEFTNSDGEETTTLATITNNPITVAANDTIDDIINKINSLRDVDDNKVVNASLTDSGRLQISTLNGLNARVNLLSATTGTLAASETFAAELGFAEVLVAEDATANYAGASVDVAANIVASSTVQSQALYKSGTEIADRSTLLDTLVRDKNGDGTINDQVITFGGDAGADTYFINIGINGGSQRAIGITAATSDIQDLLDGINNDSILQSRIEATFDETTGRLTLAALDGAVETIEFSLSATESADTDAQLSGSFGFGSNNTDLDTTAAGATGTEDSATEVIRLGAGAGEVAQARTDYNKVRAQIDALVADAGYRGVNLLNGDDLVTTFNENRTNQLTTSGSTFTASGLGIDAGSFATQSEIEASLTQVRTALSTVRNFGSSIANDLAIIQTREDFTKSLINTLSEGSDKLTVADQNEEGANLLALQTRQTLGVTSLSLASQSQQAVLRLF